MENFPTLSELLGPVEPKILIILFASVLFQQINILQTDHT